MTSSFSVKFDTTSSNNLAANATTATYEDSSDSDGDSDVDVVGAMRGAPTARGAKGGVVRGKPGRKGTAGRMDLARL